MRIACVIHSLDGGGAERIMAGLASRLASRGHEIHLITLDDGRRERYEVDAAVRRHRLGVLGGGGGVRRGRAFLRRCWSLRRAVATTRCDVVLAFCDRTNLLTLVAAAGLRARSARDGGPREKSWRPGTRLPVVISEHSDPRRQTLGRFGEWARRRLYPRARGVVVLTEPVADFMRALGCREVRVIPGAVDPPPIRSDRRRAAENRRVIALGRLAPEKSLDRLIAAFAQAAGDDSRWSLRIVGDGPQRGALVRHAETLGIADRVSFAGWVRPIWGELAASTVYALSSRYEGFPSALLEAMAVGLPCVAVDCDSGPRAILRHGEDGWLVPNDTESLAAGLRRMITDPSLREHLGGRAPEVLRRFGWESMVDAHERALADATDGPAGKAGGRSKPRQVAASSIV